MVSTASSRSSLDNFEQLYEFAGVGDADDVGPICKDCGVYLCSDTPEMPGLALANIMWGGREHSLYQNLSDAMRMLLSRGRPYFRKLVLGKGASD